MPGISGVDPMLSLRITDSGNPSVGKETVPKDEENTTRDGLK